MLRRTLSSLMVIGLALLLQTQVARADAGRSVEWQTDLRAAYDLAKAERTPLVVYLYSADENGPLSSCRALEAGALASREFNLFRQTAVFVRVNSAQDDANKNVSRFVSQSNITKVPCVSVVECQDDQLVQRKVLLGDMPTADFVRELRSGLVETSLSIRLHGRPVCNDAEYVRGVAAFQADYGPLYERFVAARQARQGLLNNLRDKREFNLDTFQAADRSCREVQTRMAERLLRFAELQSPEILALCRIEIEYFAHLSDTATLLNEDLVGWTINGQLSNPFAITAARISLRRYEIENEQVDAYFRTSGQEAARKVLERANLINQQAAARQRQD